MEPETPRWPRPVALALALAAIVVATTSTAAQAPVPAPAAGAVDQSPGPVAPPPNVVFILADDLGYGELGSYGQDKIRTPNLDRLAAGGMRFTRHYSGAPVCAPSRCVLLTGKHLGHAEIRDNRQASRSFPEFTEGQHPIGDSAFTIAEAFRAAGYTTGAFGKWGLGPVGSSGEPNRQGFDRFFGYNCQAVAHSFFPSHLWSDTSRCQINNPPVPGHAKQPEGEVKMEDWLAENDASELIAREALAFIRKAAGTGRPFFAFLPFTEPHVAMQPPRHLVESYPEGWDDRPYRGQCAYLPHPRPRAGYAAMITRLDQNVGHVLGLLEELGLDDDTAVFFTSDNGTTHPHNGDPVFGVGGVDAAFFDSTAGLRGFKGSVYEGGLRVPLIVRWPGRVAAGTTSDFPSYFPDHFPTLCALAGTDPPGDLDGVSLLPTLLGRGGQQEPRNPMVWAFPGYGGQVAVNFGSRKAVRTGLRRQQGDAGAWEVYDLDTDPGESDDLAADDPETVERARAVLREALSRNEVFPLDPEAALD